MSEMDNDILGDLLDDEIDANKEADLLPTKEDVQTLQKKVAELEKERQGLLNTTKAERRKRQASSERMAQLEGAKITQMEVRHHARQFGKSKYGLGRTVKVMSDLLLMLFLKRYLRRPMHLFGNLGVVLFAIGAAINLYLGIFKLLGHDIWGKPLLLLGILLVIAGIQFITIGIVVEIQMRTYFESQNKRPYKIRRIYTDV